MANSRSPERVGGYLLLTMGTEEKGKEMTTKEKETCADKIGSELADREAEIKRLFDLANDSEDDNERDRAWEDLNSMDYGISESKVYRVIWSGGGPADWIEITTDKYGTIEKVEYIYQDWFDGARKEVAENSAVWQYAEMMLERVSA